MNTCDVPIFDCLTHPSLDGSWIGPAPRHDNSFGGVAAAMQLANVRWAWAVAMSAAGGYDVQRYVDACASAVVTFFPAAFVNIHEFHSLEEIEDWLLLRKSQGFAGIKLHPRLGHFDFRHEWLAPIIAAASKLGMQVLLCTYFYAADAALSSLSVQTLRELLHAVADHKLILLHSGALHVLEVSEMTRPFKNVLLDLSFTMCEFAGSSVDTDIHYVLDRSRRRVCLGSDSPDFSHAQLRARFEQLTAGFDFEHCERLAYRNLFEFTGLPAGSDSYA